MEATGKRKIISDKLVIEKTGLTLEECFALLDKTGAAKMKHHEIFAAAGNISKLKPLGTWNLNLLTTSYEWSRGVKQRGEKENGFEISVSKTVAVPVNILYNAWTDDAIRKKWLQENLQFRKTTKNRSARITWSDGITSLHIDFYARGENTSQVVAQHLQLPGADKAAEMKSFWSGALNQLKAVMEV